MLGTNTCTANLRSIKLEKLLASAALETLSHVPFVVGSTTHESHCTFAFFLPAAVDFDGPAGFASSADSPRWPNSFMRLMSTPANAHSARLASETEHTKCQRLSLSPSLCAWLDNVR
jgi:hypothetical protein